MSFRIVLMYLAKDLSCTGLIYACRYSYKTVCTMGVVICIV